MPDTIRDFFLAKREGSNKVYAYKKPEDMPIMEMVKQLKIQYGDDIKIYRIHDYLLKNEYVHFNEGNTRRILIASIGEERAEKIMNALDVIGEEMFGSISTVNEIVISILRNEQYKKSIKEIYRGFEE